METRHHCYQCGAQLHLKWHEERLREICPICGWVNYPQLKVSAAAMVENHGRLLLVQRAYDPWKGCWYLPAGYVEADESPSIAAVRETFEETGLRVVVHKLRNLYYFDDDPRGNGVLIVYQCELKGGTMLGNREVLMCGFFSPQELPSPLTGAGHETAIRDWLTLQNLN